MYTEDDKYTRHGRNNSNIRSNKDNNYNSYDKNFYKNFFDINEDDSNINKKKYIVIIIILVIFFVALVCILIRSINIKKIPIGNNNNYVRLQHEQLQMKIGEEKKINLILSDVNSEYKIKWYSNNDNIVTVDDNGYIKAINEGNAIILVAYYLNDKIYDAQCYINVSK